MINVRDFIELNINRSFKLEIWDNGLEATLFDGWSDDLDRLDVLYSDVDTWEVCKDKITLNITLEE